jgi:2-(1,2-epoxy-1,2-dihydrophenyl)acetyl-CoA isomerase
VNWVAEPQELEPRALALLDRLANGPTLALARTKALLNETWERPMAAQLEAELAAFARCVPTADFHEGITAFVQKRRPEFRGK